MKLIAATRNKNKIREIQNKFSSVNYIEIISLDNIPDAPDIIEDGLTFEENAVKKAKGIAEYCGMSVMADDSGLEVAALGGEPGVFSARYAGENTTDTYRNRFLLNKMRNIPGDCRQAKFVCVIAFVINGNVYTVRGECEGEITFRVKGDNGFGYDPIFYLPVIGKTMAELSLEEKNKISHRAIALEKALYLLKNMSL